MQKRLYALWMTLLYLLLAVGIIAIIWGMWEKSRELTLPRGEITAKYTHFHCISPQNMG